MGAPTIIVDAIHLGRRIAVLADGGIALFETLIGSDGEDTDDIAAVASLPTGGWIVIDFDDFEERALH